MTPEPAPSHTQNRLYILLLITAIATLLFACSLAFVQIDRSCQGHLPGNLTSLRIYWIAYTALWLVLGTTLYWLHRTGTDRGLFSRRTDIIFILVVAGGARLIATLTTGPQLSDDIWRYIHDGRQLAAGHNPYAHAPVELTSLADDPITSRVNHPQLVSVYLPTSQYIFTALWAMHPRQLDPTAIHTFRIGFVLLDLGIIYLLITILAQRSFSPWWAIAYAWHPLPICETAASGHQESLGVFLLLMTLWLLTKKPRPSLKSSAHSGVALAAALLVKPICLPLALPIAWLLRGDPKALATVVGTAAATATVLLLPFVLMAGGVSRLFETATTFAQTWSFNSSIHQPLAALTGSQTVATAVAALVLMAVVLMCLAKGLDLFHASLVVLLASVLLSSTVYPWYLLWALALFPLCLNLPLWMLSLTITWSYTVLQNPLRWSLPTWVIAFEYLPVYALLLIRVAALPQRIRRLKHPNSHGPENSAAHGLTRP